MVVELPKSHEALEVFVVLYSSMKLEELIESFGAKRKVRVVLVAIQVLFCSSTHSIGNVMLYLYQRLGGGFKYFLFSPLFGEDSHFD